MRSHSTFAVIGAGPAGLAAAAALSGSNGSVVVFDKGKSLSQRRHDTAEDLGIGMGGAGLFSDGKFSFYPSGTQVYHLLNQEHLKNAYEWMARALNQAGIQAEPFPSAQERGSNGDTASINKKYPSHYGTLAQRQLLVEQIAGSSNARFVMGATVNRIHRTDKGYTIFYSDETGHAGAWDVSGIVLATGRLGNLDLLDSHGLIPLPSRDLRFELGLRIESPRHIGFLSREKTPDVKCIWKKDFAEIRTFCTCRRGEVWNISYGTLSAISGRSDGPPTNFSNFGLLARFAGENFERGQAAWERIINSEFIQQGNVMWQPLGEFLRHPDFTASPAINPDSRPWFPKDKFSNGHISDLIGEELYKVFVGALRELLEWSPDLLNEETVCMFPAIEGTGSYPLIDQDLKVADENIWCVGDLAGKFRGITPAMLSGHYAGLHAAEAFSRSRVRNTG